uniref:Uncharacterized protein n=1 Tax=Acrobeloides nanus TaxID=290746 RepID=A0A914DUK0_9BILA
MFVIKCLTIFFALVALASSYGGYFGYDNGINSFYGDYGNGVGQYIAQDGGRYSCNCNTYTFDGTWNSCNMPCQGILMYKGK